MSIFDVYQSVVCQVGRETVKLPPSMMPPLVGASASCMAYAVYKLRSRGLLRLVVGSGIPPLALEWIVSAAAECDDRLPPLQISSACRPGEFCDGRVRVCDEMLLATAGGGQEAHEALAGYGVSVLATCGDDAVRHPVLAVLLRSQPAWTDGVVAAFLAAVPAVNGLSTFGARAAATWLLTKHEEELGKPWDPDDAQRVFEFARQGCSCTVGAIDVASLFLRHELFELAAECCLDAVSAGGGAASHARLETVGSNPSWQLGNFYDSVAALMSESDGQKLRKLEGKELLKRSWQQSAPTAEDEDAVGVWQDLVQTDHYVLYSHEADEATRNTLLLRLYADMGVPSAVGKLSSTTVKMFELCGL
jgi:hypothetical protein